MSTRYHLIVTAKFTSGSETTEGVYDSGTREDMEARARTIREHPEYFGIAKLTAAYLESDE